jgi:hypothetical protein
MALVIASRSVETNQGVAYPVLLAATACLVLGFGLTVPALNTFTAEFHPGAVDRSVLVLNALLGLGTALAPVFVAIFVGLGAWVGLPILAAALLVGLFAVSLRLPLRTGPAGEASGEPGRADAGAQRPAARAPRPHAAIPRAFWVFAAFAVLYGFCETMNGNWCQIDLTALHVSATTASLTLTVFWAMVTASRVLFAVIQRWVPSRLAYHIVPFVLAGAFAFIATLPAHGAAAGMLAFGLAGPGLLSAAAADDQLRAGTAGQLFRVGRQRRDRLLPARIRHCRVRSGPAQNGRVHLARDLRRQRRRGRAARAASHGRGPPPPFSGGAASAAGYSPQVTFRDSRPLARSPAHPPSEPPKRARALTGRTPAVTPGLPLSQAGRRLSLVAPHPANCHVK